MDRSQRAEHHQQQQLNWQKSLSPSNGQAQAQFAGLQQHQTLPSSEMFTETMLPLSSDWHYMASGALLGANADEAALLRQMLSQTGLSDSMRCHELQSPSSNLNAAAISIKEEDGCGLMCLPDPGFAERAARFSSFGGKFGHADVSGGAFRRARDSSSAGFLGGNVNNGANVIARTANCPATVDGKDGICSSAVAPAAAGLMAVPEEASVVVSDKSSAGRACNDSGSRKRKSDRSNAQNQRGSSDSSESKDKRSKSTEKEDSKMKSDEASIKPASNNNEHSAESSPRKDVKPEPPKDYIHVRARRGQATDSHSLAERVRREKISERMRYLQDLVPGCNKVTGKAVMLDEIINYVKSLQRQVEFLSMKLAAVNPRLDFNIDHLIPKEMMAAPAACGNFSAAAASGPLATDIASFIQFQHIQQQQQAASLQAGPSCGSDMATVVTSAEASSLHGPDSSAEMFVDANFQGHPPSSWETADFRNIFNPPMMHSSRQGQPQAHQFSCHSLAGHLELNQNKMEM